MNPRIQNRFGKNNGQCTNYSRYQGWYFRLCNIGKQIVCRLKEQKHTDYVLITLELVKKLCEKKLIT